MCKQPKAASIASVKRPAALLLSLLLPTAVAAAPPAVPLLDATALPAPARAAYAAFLLGSLPRAFALSPSGAFGWAANRASPEAAREAAVAVCAGHGAAGCALYAEGLDIVWPGRAWHAPAPPAPYIETMNEAFVPDPRFLWFGPGRAAGVVVWGHGKGRSDEDHRGLQPPPLLRWFNAAGFDVVRFDRAPMVDDRTRAAGWLREGLATLRARGYGTVIVGGQSRGAWNALQMLEQPGLADAILAVSPAAHGAGASLNLPAQTDDLRAILDAAPPQRTRVAVVQFEQDPFASDADRRRALLDARLGPKLPALLVIDRPAGLAGHGAGLTAAFGRRFGACLLGFLTGSGAAPPASCRVAAEAGADADPERQ